MQYKNKIQTKGWRKVKLGEIVEFVKGKKPKQLFYKKPSEDFLEYVLLGDQKIYVKPEDSLVRVLPTDIIIVADGASSGTIFTGKNGILGSTFLRIKIRPEYEKEINSRYLYFYLKYSENIFKSLLTGSAIPHVDQENLRIFEVLIPKDINEQKRIVNILSAFDDKIELNNKIIKTLEEMAQEIFKEWILKNQKLKVKSQKLGDLADIKYGQGSSLSKLKKGGYPVYGANGIIGYSDSYDFPDRQIIIGCRGVVGNVTLTLPKCTVTHNSLVITPRNNRKIFFYYLLKNQNLDAVVGGSAQPQITIRDLEQFELAMPEEKLQDKFESIVGDIERKRLVIFYENQTLTVLRDLLLPKLMSGEIRV
jgi:type I restriction enzyme S subunit